MYEFQAFPKIARHDASVVVTEKIDGTNAQIAIFEVESPSDFIEAIVLDDWRVEEKRFVMLAGSRNRWIHPQDDNFGFSAWVLANRVELRKLGPGRHYGEWYGKGIQGGYGLEEKRLALFNVARWGAHNPSTPACVGVVPVLAQGKSIDVGTVMRALELSGTHVERPGLEHPYPAEGVVVYHSISRTLTKHTFRNIEGKWRGE